MNDRLREVLANVLEVESSAISAETSVESEPRWDSLRHMTLIFAIEDAFGVQFDDDELPKLTSVAAIQRALDAR